MLPSDSPRKSGTEKQTCTGEDKTFDVDTFLVADGIISSRCLFSKHTPSGDGVM